jgi:hypothetical protein
MIRTHWPFRAGLAWLGGSDWVSPRVVVREVLAKVVENHIQEAQVLCHVELVIFLRLLHLAPVLVDEVESVGIAVCRYAVATPVMDSKQVTAMSSMVSLSATNLGT